ncbi:MAG: hypothetical protein M0C28_07850 [Candidatus Moduliflexus flocculans]|nr:hypothetical protein [Candidatus Moduliflexus flocculans]
MHKMPLLEVIVAAETAPEADRHGGRLRQARWARPSIVVQRRARLLHDPHPRRPT